jgi:Ca2+-binding EF-hand superfamily protein
MGNNAGHISAEELTDRTHLTEVEVENLLNLYRAHVQNLKPVDLLQFRQLLLHVYKLHPHPAFNQQCAELTFYMLNTQQGKVGAEELVLGVSAILHGSDRERAELLFRAMDTKNTGYLTRTLIVRRVDLIVGAAAKIIDREINSLNSFQRINMGIALKGAQASIKRELVNQIYLADQDGDDRLSFDEWMKAVEGGHEVIIAICDPARSLTMLTDLLKQSGEQQELGARIVRAAKYSIEGVKKIGEAATEAVQKDL